MHKIHEKNESVLGIANKYVNYNDKVKNIFLLANIINKYVNSYEKEIIALKSITKIPHSHFLLLS